MSYGEWIADNNRRFHLVAQAKRLADRIVFKYYGRSGEDERVKSLIKRAYARAERREKEYAVNLLPHGLRLREQYGDVELSIVAGYGLYSLPRDKSGTYTHVECAIISDSGAFLTPDDVGITDEDVIERYDGNAIFGYVPWPVVDKIRDHLRNRSESEV